MAIFRFISNKLHNTSAYSAFMRALLSACGRLYLGNLLLTLTKLIRLEKRRKRSSTPPILELPTELLIQITSPLPLISRACLALSCKLFLGFFGSALSADEFRLQRRIFDHDADVWRAVNLRRSSR